MTALTNKHQRGFAIVQIVWVLAGLLVASAAAWHVIRDARDTRDAQIAFATPYQAVLLANGSVYFGKLEGYGTEPPSSPRSSTSSPRPIPKPSKPPTSWSSAAKKCTNPTACI